MSNRKGRRKKQARQANGGGSLCTPLLLPSYQQDGTNQTPRRSAPTHDDSFKPAGEGGAVA